MKKIFSLFLVSIACTTAFGATAENDMYFRAMQDEMNRTLKELRLPGELRPYYVAYMVTDNQSMRLTASLGALFPQRDSHSLNTTVFVHIGNDKKNNTGYFNRDNSWRYRATETAPYSYEGIRQALWSASYNQYLESVEQYKEKEAYLRKKNIKDLKPDVIPAPQATYIEPLPAWQPADTEPLKNWLQTISLRGKEVPFLIDFSVGLEQTQNNRYYLNSRGAKAQYPRRYYACWVRASFRQPDGGKENLYTTLDLRDFSAPELARAEQEVERFLTKAQGLYGAKEAEYYLGPVLYKPTAAAKFLQKTLRPNLENIVPLFNSKSAEDTTASSWRKKIGRRVMSPGITVYDRPQASTYKGIELYTFTPVDIEGVAGQDLTIISGGRLRQVPLSERPLELKNHRSNGHAWFDDYGVREDTTALFIEPEVPLTDEQMEEKLLARCKELELPYCYIKEGSFFQRVYTQDGRKEWVLGLTDNLSERSLRDILAAGGEEKLVYSNIITPSLLVDEVELEPQDRRPDRKPLIEKPE